MMVELCDSAISLYKPSISPCPSSCYNISLRYTFDKLIFLVLLFSREWDGNQEGRCCSNVLINLSILATVFFFFLAKLVFFFPWICNLIMIRSNFFFAEIFKCLKHYFSLVFWKILFIVYYERISACIFCYRLYFSCSTNRSKSFTFFCIIHLFIFLSFIEKDSRKYFFFF